MIKGAGGSNIRVGWMAKNYSCVPFAVTLLAALQCSTVIAQTAQPENKADAEAASGQGLVEIIVTAQRRAETLERTPVAISAVSADALEQQQIVTQQDLQIAVPGLTVKAGQYDNQLNYSLRGQTVDAFTSSRPSVLPYFNEVQVGGTASSALYDLASVQVLKGPQGTLFGRNATGGAVLLTTAKPTNEFGGFLSVRAGNYNDREYTAVLNVPLIADKLLLRVAGFAQRREGYQFNLYDYSRLGDVRRDNIRISLTAKPTDNFTNDLVVDGASAGGSNTTGVLKNVLPIGSTLPNGSSVFVPANLFYSPASTAFFANVNAFGLGTFQNFYPRFLAAHPSKAPPSDLANGLVAFADTQRQRGPFLVDINAPDFHRNNNLVISNASKLDLSSDTQLKNIIGYTHLYENDSGEFDGSPFPIDGGGSPRGRQTSETQFSDEFQLIGKGMGGKLSYVTGLFYSSEKTHEFAESVEFDLLPYILLADQFNEGQFKDKTYAGYGQGTYDLSDLVGIHGLSATLGARYTSEKIDFLHSGVDTYLTHPIPAGATFTNPLSDTFNKVSWQVGLQDQINPDLLVYVVSRRGNRSGGFNFFAPPLAGFGNQGGSEYKPEVATDVELGLKFQGDLADMPVRLNIAAYNMWILDIQRANYVSIFNSLAGITVNVPKSIVSGVEIDGTIKPAPWLTVGASLNGTAARFTDNVVTVPGNVPALFGPYPDTPKWSGSTYADVSVPVNARLTASLRADFYAQTKSYYSSSVDSLNAGAVLPGYGMADFRLGIEDKDAGWAVSATLKNAFNHVYYVGGLAFYSLFAANTEVPGAPRTVVVEARYKF